MTSLDWSTVVLGMVVMFSVAAIAVCFIIDAKRKRSGDEREEVNTLGDLLQAQQREAMRKLMQKRRLELVANISRLFITVAWTSVLAFLCGTMIYALANGKRVMVDIEIIDMHEHRIELPDDGGIDL